MGSNAQRFDDQALAFDQRAGLPAGVGQAIGRAVLELVGPGDRDVLLEIGAGTGEIGQHLASSTRYVALDRSFPMLEVFRTKLRTAHLVQCDAEQVWPVRTRSVAGVLASRVAHLLEAGHLLTELHRVCRPGAPLLIGRVERDPGSVRSLLRQQRRLLLREQGTEPRDGAASVGKLVDRIVVSGGTPFETRTVATWTVMASPADVLASWEAMTPSTPSGLAEWARAAFGDLDQAIASVERYTLAGARLDHLEEPWTTRS